MIATRTTTRTTTKPSDVDGSTLNTSVIEASLEIYREALVLNNEAVSLLHKGCYDRALKMQRESLSHLQQTFVASRNAKRKRDLSGSSMKTVPAASRRTRPDQSAALVSNTQHVNVYPVDENDFYSLVAATKHSEISMMDVSSKGLVIHPVYIRESPANTSSSCHSRESNLVVARHSSIILYNHGILEYIAWTAATETDKRKCHGQIDHKREKSFRKNLNAALKSLKLCESNLFSLLYRRRDVSADELGPCGDDDNQVLMLLATLTLSCLGHVCSKEEGLLLEAQRAQRMLVYLRHRMEEEHTYTHMCSGGLAAPLA